MLALYFFPTDLCPLLNRNPLREPLGNFGTVLLGKNTIIRVYGCNIITAIKLGICCCFLTGNINDI